jgi:hypothetical protein
VDESSQVNIFVEQLNSMLEFVKKKRENDVGFDGFYDHISDEICATLSAFEELQTTL